VLTSREHSLLLAITKQEKRMSKTIKRETTKGFIQHLEHQLKERKLAKDFDRDYKIRTQDLNL
jgi:hypothetical protein